MGKWRGLAREWPDPTSAPGQVVLRFCAQPHACHTAPCARPSAPALWFAAPACTAEMPKRDCTIEYKDSAAARTYMKEKMKAQVEAKKAAKADRAITGSVKPTFGGSNPFSGGSLFGAKEPNLDEMGALERKLYEEKQAKKAAAGKGGGWPFG